MHQNIIDFWFNEIDSTQWWKKDDAFDALIVERFAEVHHQATQCELYNWRQTGLGRLAEIIVLDQFSRNMFRNSPEAFAYDALSLALAQTAVAGGHDLDLNPVQRAFLYMPYMHSESLAIHEEAVRLFTDLRVESTLTFELKHKAIIERFGRYPHRNAILGRESTEEELAFLAQPGSSF